MKTIQLVMMFCITCFLIYAFTPDETRIIKGTVLDEKHQPIQGASVTIKGTKTGAATDSAGHFTIKVNQQKVVLIIACVGYENIEYAVKKTDVLTIRLRNSSSELAEVVVTGYGTAKPIEEADKEVSRMAFTAPALVKDQLAGRVAGLAITRRGMKRQNATNGVGYDKKFFSPNPNSDYNREGYDKIEENPFLKATDNPLSTFSIDVDAASYSNVRRYLNDGELPPAGAVRIEEMINYFRYQYPQPTGDAPFGINTELATCPWNKKHKLMMIGLQGKIIPTENLPASNLVFLIDVSGSMMDENKLPLVKSSLKLLVDQLRPQDKVSLVVYAGNAGLVLSPASGDRKTTIKDAIDRLEAGGSTAGGEGIQLAYQTAKQNFVTGGNNRVILCTDGDFNVGLSSDDALETMIEKERESGVFLTVLGYGMGNYQDAKMQKLADKGNGNHAYIDGISEANKVLVQQFGGTLFTIAKDVKLQIEFNPAKVHGYRLIGYENRMLAKEDFNNDAKDAGELGSGHTVTALYEIIPAGADAKELNTVDALRYATTKTIKTTGNFGDEIINIKLRYKQPDGKTSSLLQQPVPDKQADVMSLNFKLAASVAQFGMLLRNSAYANSASYANAKLLATEASADDKEGYRKELVQLIQKATKIGEKELTKKDE